MPQCHTTLTATPTLRHFQRINASHPTTTITTGQIVPTSQIVLVVSNLHPHLANQLDTVRDLDKRSLLLVLTTFGHHLLHHLFPSIDHSRHSRHQTDDIRLLIHRLEALYPALWETCEEFGESYPFQTLHTMVIHMVTISIQSIPKRLLLFLN